MTNGEETLGGYLRTHRCPPTFLGCDGVPYSAEAYVDERCREDERFGGALIFVRWSESGSKPVGHLETGYLAHGDTPEIAQAMVEGLTLFELKEHLDRLIEESKGIPDW